MKRTFGSNGAVVAICFGWGYKPLYSFAFQYLASFGLNSWGLYPLALVFRNGRF